MIRYPVSKAQLEALIEAEKPGWLAKAAKKTETFRDLGHYDEASSDWSEVKAVYMRLQGGGKCAYCERKLEWVAFGRVEQDIEHFRPKGNIKPWKLPKKLTAQGITATPAPDAGKGYYLLPYHPFNYAAACKPCNSTLKKDYFPIAGQYALDEDDPSKLADERAYLVYPIGSIDDDPEQLITFYGLSPKPVATAASHTLHRALVTIEFFQLDEPEKRKNLYRERAFIILALFALLEKTTVGTPEEMKRAKDRLDSLLTPALAHLNCAKSFVRLFNDLPQEARAIYDRVLQFLSSIS